MTTPLPTPLTPDSPPRPESALHPEAALRRGRWLLISAACLWSLSAFFTRLLQNESPLGLESPALSPLQISFWRSFFAGAVFLPLLRPRMVHFRPLMPLMVGLFALMNATFMIALAQGSAANAILLQNAAPLWVWLFLLFVPGSQRGRGALPVFVGMAGVLTIVLLSPARPDADNDRHALVVALGVASGVLYAGVVLCLRSLRREAAEWLTIQNHLGSAFCLGLTMLLVHGSAFWVEWMTTPTAKQLAFLFVFGSVQMALPYLLFAKGLQVVGPAEAATITLLEPLLNPVWAWLVSPATDTPGDATLIGGGMILAALVLSVLPKRTRPR